MQIRVKKTTKKPKRQQQQINSNNSVNDCSLTVAAVAECSWLISKPGVLVHVSMEFSIKDFLDTE